MGRVQLAAVVLVSAVSLWMLPIDSADQVLDWMTVRAVVDGHDPYAPTRELANIYDINIGNQAPHPRLPGALLLTLPLAVLPVTLVPVVGKALVIVALVLAVLLVRPSMFAFPVLAIPAVHAVHYANSSAVVTLLTVFAVRGSGVALAVAATLRLWPWFIGLALLLLGRWRAAVVGAFTFVGLNAIGLLLPGVSVSGTWRAMNATRNFIEAESKASFDLPLAVGFGLAVVSLVAVYRLRSIKWSVIGGLALSPVIWLHYLTALLIPLSQEDRRVSLEANASISPEP